MSKSPSVSEIFALTRDAAIRRTIARAQKKEQHGIQTLTNDFLYGLSYDAERSGIFGTILQKALESQGRQIKNLPSIRLKAPDTGGRPFHFAHRFVNKTNIPHADGGAKQKKTKSGSNPSAGKNTTKRNKKTEEQARMSRMHSAMRRLSTSTSGT